MKSFFLNPGLLWYCSLASIPIIIHLLNKKKYTKIKWAAMDFLLAALKKSRRRMQVENLLLLLLRVILILLFCIGLAQPLINANKFSWLSNKNVHHIIVLDNSYSMLQKANEQNSFLKAKDYALNIIESSKVEKGDLISVIKTSPLPEAVLKETTIQKARLKEALNNLNASYSSAKLSDSLSYALSIAENSVIGLRKVYVISDLQANTWSPYDNERKEKLGSVLRELSNKTDLTIINVASKTPANIAVTSISSDNKLHTNKKISFFTGYIKNFGASSLFNIQVSIKIDDFLKDVILIPELAPGTTEPVKFSHLFKEPGFHYITVSVNTDDIPYDNVAYLSVNVKDGYKVLLVNGKSYEHSGKYSTILDENYYISRALSLSSDEENSISFYETTTVSEYGFNDINLSQYDIICLSNISYLTSEKAEVLRKVISEGKGVMIFLGNDVDPIIFNQILYNESNPISPCKLITTEGLTVDKLDSENITLYHLSRIDFSSPLMKIFEPYKSSLLKIIYLKFYNMQVKNEDKGVNIIASYDDINSTPAIIERKIGSGKLILFNTTAGNNWSFLPKLKEVFVPLIRESAEYLIKSDLANYNIKTFEPIIIDLNLSQYNSIYTLTDPSLNSMTLYPSQIPDKHKYILQFNRTDTSGLYTISSTNNSSKILIATNLDTIESDIKSLAINKVSKIYKLDNTKLMDGALPSQTKEKKNNKTMVKNSIWKKIIIISLIILLIESLLSAYIDRKRT